MRSEKWVNVSRKMRSRCSGMPSSSFFWRYLQPCWSLQSDGISPWRSSRRVPAKRLTEPQRHHAKIQKKRKSKCQRSGLRVRDTALSGQHGTHIRDPHRLRACAWDHAARSSCPVRHRCGSPRRDRSVPRDADRVQSTPTPQPSLRLRQRERVSRRHARSCCCRRS
jgi:hypothetical protein